MNKVRHFVTSSAVLTGITASLFAQQISDPLAPENAISNLELYPGVSATLFASEPMISSVTNIDVDHRGGHQGR